MNQEKSLSQRKRRRMNTELALFFGEEELVFSDSDEEEEYHNQLRSAWEQRQRANNITLSSSNNNSHKNGVTNIKEQILQICCDKCSCCRKIREVLTTPHIIPRTESCENYDSGIGSLESLNQNPKKDSEQNNRDVEINIISCQKLPENKKSLENLPPNSPRNIRKSTETNTDHSSKNDKGLEKPKIKVLANLLVDDGQSRRSSLDKIIDTIKKRQLSSVLNESQKNTQDKKQPNSRQKRSKSNVNFNSKTKRSTKSYPKAHESSDHNSFTNNKKDKLKSNAKKNKLKKNEEAVFKVPLDTTVTSKTLPASLVKKLRRTGGIAEFKTKPSEDFRCSFNPEAKKSRRLYTSDVWLNSQEFSEICED